MNRTILGFGLAALLAAAFRLPVDEIAGGIGFTLGLVMIGGHTLGLEDATRRLGPLLLLCFATTILWGGAASFVRTALVALDGNLLTMSSLLSDPTYRGAAAARCADPATRHFLTEVLPSERQDSIASVRGTVSRKTMALRYQAYFRYWNDGGARHDFGASAYRVLTVTTHERSLLELEARAREAPPRRSGTRLFWFARASDITLARPESVLDPIWSVATRNRMTGERLFPPRLLQT